jgi:hypothetical protein
MLVTYLRRGAIALLAYLAVALVLVVAQFTRTTGFFETIGIISLRGYYQSGTDAEDRPIDWASLTLPGANFRFAADRPLDYVDSKGRPGKASLVSYAREGKNLELAFEKGLTLLIETKENSISIKLDGARSATLASSTPIATDDEGLPLLLGTDGMRYETRFDDIDVEAGTIALSGSRKLSLSRVDPGEAPATSSTVTQAPMEKEQFEGAIKRFVDKAWNGWDKTRFNPSRIEWTGANGTAYSDHAAAAYLAEANRRGSGQAAFDKVKGARATQASKLTWLTSPYFGNLVQKMRIMEQEDLAEVKRITEAVRASDPSIFAKEGLVAFLFDRSPYSLAQEATAFAARVDPDRFSPAQLAAFLGSMSDSRAFYADSGSNPFLSHETVPERLLSYIRKTPDGFFLDRGDGLCELRLSILAGWNLIRWGKGSSRDVFIGVGQSLVVSALNLASDDGTLPARIDVRDGTASKREGRLDPEFVYPIVAENEYYPHEKSFFPVAGPGAWAWTATPGLALTLNTGSVTLTAKSTVGKSYFITVYGIKPYKQVRIYDKQWPGDPQFEMYDASGYQYFPKTGAVYLKMKHKKEIETVTMVY